MGCQKCVLTCLVLVAAVEMGANSRGGIGVGLFKCPFSAGSKGERRGGAIGRAAAPPITHTPRLIHTYTPFACTVCCTGGNFLIR